MRVRIETQKYNRHRSIYPETIKTQLARGWTFLENKEAKTSLAYTFSETLQRTTKSKPISTAIDAPFSLPKNDLSRKAAKEMMRRGYTVFRQTFQP